MEFVFCMCVMAGVVYLLTCEKFTFVLCWKNLKCDKFYTAHWLNSLYCSSFILLTLTPTTPHSFYLPATLQNTVYRIVLLNGGLTEYEAVLAEYRNTEDNQVSVVVL